MLLQYNLCIRYVLAGGILAVRCRRRLGLLLVLVEVPEWSKGAVSLRSDFFGLR